MTNDIDQSESEAVPGCIDWMKNNLDSIRSFDEQMRHPTLV